MGCIVCTGLLSVPTRLSSCLVSVSSVSEINQIP